MQTQNKNCQCEKCIVNETGKNYLDNALSFFPAIAFTHVKLLAILVSFMLILVLRSSIKIFLLLMDPRSVCLSVKEEG